MHRLLSRNVTTLLLLEPIELSYGVLDYYGLEEAFIADIDREDLKDCVICLFNISKIEGLQEYLESTLQENPNFLEDYDYNGYVAVAFKFPAAYMDDYNLIKEGKYSQVSEGFKKLYGNKIEFIDKKTSKHFQASSVSIKIINRNIFFVKDMEKFLGTSLHNNQEAWKSFDIEKETLDINKYELPFTFTESDREA